MKPASFSNKELRNLEQEAKRNCGESEKVVSAYLSDLETRYKIPIVFEKLNSEAGAAGTCRTVWQQRVAVAHHSIDLAPCEPWCRSHRLAHELVHFELECVAHEAGKRKTDCLATEVGRFWVEKWKSEPRAHKFLSKVLGISMNFALDLVVEKRIERDFPVLYPSQLLNLHSFQREQAIGGDIAILGGPPEFNRAIRALEGVVALSVDKLSGNRSQHFSRFRNFPESVLARELYNDFRQEFPKLGPGDHYNFVDRVCKKIGFPGLHVWDPRPCYELLAEHAHTSAEEVLQQLAPKPGISFDLA